MAQDGKSSGRLLTYRQVANRLGYSVGTVRNKVADGELPLTKIKLADGRQGAVRFAESEVEAWIEERAEAQSSNGGST